MRTPELHRCEECGGIAEWHYYLKYGSKGELGIALGLSDGQKGFAPGQGRNRQRDAHDSLRPDEAGHASDVPSRLMPCGEERRALHGYEISEGHPLTSDAVSASRNEGVWGSTSPDRLAQTDLTRLTAVTRLWRHGGFDAHTATRLASAGYTITSVFDVSQMRMETV